MKRWSKGVVVGVLTSSVITAGILEITIRALNLIPDNAPIAYQAVSGDEGFAPVPNSSSRSLFGVLHRTDSRGLRGPERSLAREPGRARVAVLGDSVVWGHGIPEEYTISAWLERLGQHQGSGLETWNLGVPAYNTYNERARYASFALLLRPDVTIVVVLFNDLQPGPQRFRITSVGTLSDLRLRAPYPDELRPILEKSAVFQTAIRIYRSVAFPKGEAFDLVSLPGMIGQIDVIRATAVDVGSALIVAAMPSSWVESKRFEKMSNGLKEFCEKRQVPFVDLSAVLGSPARRDYLLPADADHPTAEGARLIAEALLPAVGDALKRREVR